MKFLSNTLYLFLLTLCSVTAYSQNDWQWGQEVNFDARHIAVDTYGNSYVVWGLENAYTIDDETFFSNGSNDAALTSFDCDGAHRWTKTIGGQNGDAIYGLGVDTMGGVYVTGRFNAFGNFDVNVSNDTVVSGYTVKGFFLVKYDLDGEFQWFRMPEDTAVLDPTNIQLAGALDLDVAPNGDCYIFSKLPPGSYGNGGYEATQEGTSSGGGNIHVLKYDSEGNCTGGTHLDLWYDSGLFAKSEIIRDHYTGRYYLAGNRNDDDVFIFGGEEIEADNYVVQFDEIGNVNWVVSGEDVRFKGKPDVDEIGNVYVSGGTEDGASLGAFTFQNVVSSSNFPFFAQIDPSGNVIYASNGSGTTANSCEGIAYSNGRIGVTGYWGSILSWEGVGGDITDQDSQGFNVFLTIFDISGEEIVPNSFHYLIGPPIGVETPSLLTIDPLGNFYVGGQFSSQLYVGDGTLYNQSGPNEGFIAKFGTDTCYCPLPEAAFEIDSMATQAEYIFTYTGTAEVDSVVWDFGDGTTATELNLEHLFAESGDYTVCVTAYNECGPDSTCLSLSALGPVGVRTVDGYPEIAIYPNPARDIITIDNAISGIQMDIFNAVGQLVQTELVMQSPAQIDVSSLETGIYLIQFSQDDGVVGYARFMKSD